MTIVSVKPLALDKKTRQDKIDKSYRRNRRLGQDLRKTVDTVDIPVVREETIH